MCFITVDDDRFVKLLRLFLTKMSSPDGDALRVGTAESADVHFGAEKPPENTSDGGDRRRS